MKKLRQGWLCLRISIIVCVHNEAPYLGRCLSSIFLTLEKAQAEPDVIVICDRCSDDSAQLARDFPVLVIEKKESRWRNSYAENLQMGLERASGEFTAVVDADIALEPDYFTKLLPSFRDPRVDSVSGRILTEASGIFNRIYSIWERSYDIINLGREPRGGARIYRTRELKEAGFRDVMAPDTEVDLRLKGKRRYLSDAIALHTRRMTIGRAINGQIRAGMARRELKSPFWRVLLHSILRLRPFVLYGYLFGTK